MRAQWSFAQWCNLSGGPRVAAQTSPPFAKAQKTSVTELAFLNLDYSVLSASEPAMFFILYMCRIVSIFDWIELPLFLRQS